MKIHSIFVSLFTIFSSFFQPCVAQENINEVNNDVIIPIEVRLTPESIEQFKEIFRDILNPVPVPEPTVEPQPAPEPIPQPQPVVEPEPQPEPTVGPSDGVLSDSVSYWSFSWELDHPVLTGKFINGEPWVVGPVVVKTVSPSSSNGLHGSMLNPVPRDLHGFDKRVYSYNESANVKFPLQMQPGDSLVSTQSWVAGESGAPTIPATIPGAPRPSLKRAAVLTCLDKPPPVGSFRPWYSGAQPKLSFSVGDLNISKLPVLQNPNGHNLPNVGNMSHVWLDVGRLDWVLRYLHPSENLPDYGRDIAYRYNMAATVACITRDEDLIHDLVQIGIDIYGLLLAEGVWRADGGHMSGRKFPILLAGLLLNNQNMLNIAKDHPTRSVVVDGKITSITPFAEDCQSYYNNGVAKWSGRRCYNPSDTSQEAKGYDRCCTINVWALSQLITLKADLKDEWSNNAFFDLVDSHVRRTDLQNWERAWTDWALSVWLLNR